MNELACVLLKVDMVDPDILFLTTDLDSYSACTDDRIVKLGYLICLWKVGIEIVLSVKNRELIYLAAQSIACLNGILYSGPVDYREGTRHTRTYGADSRIRRTAEFSGAVTKYLCLSQKLGMDLKTYDGSVFTHLSLPPFQSLGLTGSKPFSNALVTCKTVASSKLLPTTDIPIGIPFAL